MKVLAQARRGLKYHIVPKASTNMSDFTDLGKPLCGEKVLTFMAALTLDAATSQSVTCQLCWRLYTTGTTEKPREKRR